MWNKGQKSFYFLWVVTISCLQNQFSQGIFIEELDVAKKCDLFRGSWVLDENDGLPLYVASKCPFVAKEFDCQGNGRPDQLYLKYRWQPSGCDLPRFNGGDFLKRLKGKKIMFVGDSLSRNQFQSLKCMLYSASPNPKFTWDETPTISTFTLQENNVTILLNQSPFLVDMVSENGKKILKIDSVSINSKAWRGMDVLIFNSYHWWTHRGSLQKWDYIKLGNKLYKDMDRMAAYKVGLTTWAKWVDSNINIPNQKVFFQNISPTHIIGSEWGQPGSTCKNQTKPIMGSTYPSELPNGVKTITEVLGKMKTKVELLDITRLSQLRKDGHPSIYSQDGMSDCSHWCVAGVPDTWNQLLYALLLSDRPLSK